MAAGLKVLDVKHVNPGVLTPAAAHKHIHRSKYQPQSQTQNRQKRGKCSCLAFEEPTWVTCLKQLIGEMEKHDHNDTQSGSVSSYSSGLFSSSGNLLQSSLTLSIRLNSAPSALSILGFPLQPASSLLSAGSGMSFTLGQHKLL